eukprot:gene32819-42485_t
MGSVYRASQSASSLAATQDSKHCSAVVDLAARPFTVDTYMSCFADHAAELRCFLFIDNNIAPSMNK